jgi:hypothetical protein
MSCKFISSEIRVYCTYMLHILQHFMQLPIINFYFFIYARGFLKIISMWGCHCSNISMFILEWKFSYMSEASVRFISVNVICFSLDVTKSSQCSWLISLCAKRVAFSSLEPGITVPITSKVLPSELDSSAVHPHAWLTPVIKILFLWGLQVRFSSLQLLHSRPNLEMENLLVLLGGYLLVSNFVQWTDIKPVTRQF